MAKGTDSEEFVVMSNVRTGLKREFVFALKAQAEVSGSLGRTRRAQNDGCKRLKTEERNGGDGDEKLGGGEMGEGEIVKVKEDLEEAMSEEDAKSDVVDLTSEDEPKSHVGEFVLSERVGEDELKHCVLEMAVDEEPQTGCIGDNEPKKPLVDEEVPVLIENASVKVEDEVIEKPVRRFTRSALKLEAEKMQNLPAEGYTQEIDSEIQKSPFVTPMKLDTKMPKMVRKLSKLKELLDTGILEGQPVKYLRRSKVLFRLVLLFFSVHMIADLWFRVEYLFCVSYFLLSDKRIWRNWA